LDINYIGHSTFELHEGLTRVLIDPFLAPNNPVAKVTAEDLDPTHVLVTHGHADHIADAVAVGKHSDAKFIAQTETARWLADQGCDVQDEPNLGGTVSLPGGSVKVVQAFHSSTTPDGTVTYNSGLIVTLGDTTVYHVGDTCLFGDLRLIGEIHEIDIALVPIGGYYTMDRHDAVLAVEMIGAKTVIPCHYNTFPPIETDADAFKQQVEAKTDSTVIVLDPGQSYSVGAAATA
jgi:L-ascorbate metabolism protein UlaG (beta-lactamase superfamily)